MSLRAKRGNLSAIVVELAICRFSPSAACGRNQITGAEKNERRQKKKM
jgi:hypothetical protein